MRTGSSRGVTTTSSGHGRGSGSADGAVRETSSARRRPVYAILSALVLLALLLVAGTAQASAAGPALLSVGVSGAPLVGTPVVTTSTWKGGGGNALWSTAANWQENLAPVAGNRLIFPASPTSYATQNDLTPGTRVAAIAIADGGYTFSGNAIQLDGGISTTYASGTLTFPLGITLNQAQTFSISGAGGLSCTGNLSGSNALTKTGTGTLTVTHSNAGFSGNVAISEGAIGITDSTALGIGAITAQSGASLACSGGITVANAITLNGYGVSGSGAIQSNGGANTYSGAITLGSDAGIGVWAGSMSVSSVSGAYALRKSGTDLLVVTGIQTLTGGYAVSAGTLQVDGTLISSTTTSVSFGATLDGTGTTGAVTVASGGTLAPGHSPGTLTTAGLTLSSGATLNEEIDGATAGTQYDQLVVTGGGVDLAGATLAASGSITSSEAKLTIIDNRGASPITGTFAGLPEGSTVTVNGVDFRISYVGGDGNDVTLSREPVPTTFQISAGNDQSAVVGTAFATALKVRVLDQDSDPLAGASVTFAAPGSGASGAFASSPAVTTDSDGYATAPTFTANTTVGSYQVTASTEKLTALDFSLTNTGPASSLTVAAGNNQSTKVSTAFATRLKALVKDAYGNPVSGASVTFTAPASGTSGTFASSSTVTSDGTGVAEAPVLTANATAGSYTVSASTAGVGTPASFNLTNTVAPQITSAAGATFTEGIAGSFTVTTTGAPKPALTAAGALPSGVTFVDNADGTATLSGTPTAGAGGDYSLTLTAANGVPSDATQAFVLHVSPRIPPVTTVGGVSSGWVRHRVHLTFSATPGTGGPPVAYTEFRVGSGDWRRGVSATIDRQGVTRVAYRSADTEGDVEETQVCMVRIDSVPPVVTDYGHPVAWQGGWARFAFRVTDAGASTVRAKLVITRYGQPVHTVDLGRQATGKRLVAIVSCWLPVGTWNWRLDVRDPAGVRGVGRRHALEVYPR